MSGIVKAEPRNADLDEMDRCAGFKWGGIVRHLTLVVCVVACGPATLPAPPDELLGTWRTTAPGYEHRYLAIEPDRLEIGAGRHVLEQHPIERIEVTESESGDEVYELHYMADEGYPDSIRLVMRPGTPGVIRMPNRSEPWTRDP